MMMYIHVIFQDITMLFSHWLTIASICVLGAMSPGPSLAVVIKNTLEGSRWHGMVAGIGHGLGVWIYATVSVLGLGLVIQNHPQVFQAIQLLGAGFLFWLGIQSLRSTEAPLAESGIESKRLPRQAFVSGFLISFLNPKIAIFFIALFSQFVDPQNSLAVKLLYSTTAGVIDLAWYCLVAAAFGHRYATAFLKRWMHRIEQVLGVILIALGVRLAFYILL